MRISDWSSDVCSSDLKLAVPVVVALREVDSLWLVVSISVALVVVLLPTLPLEFVRDRRDVPVTLPLIVPALFRTTLLFPLAVTLPSPVPVAPPQPVAAPPAPADRTPTSREGRFKSGYDI